MLFLYLWLFLHFFLLFFFLFALFFLLFILFLLLVRLFSFHSDLLQQTKSRQIPNFDLICFLITFLSILTLLRIYFKGLFLNSLLLLLYFLFKLSQFLFSYCFRLSRLSFGHPVNPRTVFLSHIQNLKIRSKVDIIYSYLKETLTIW